ncbi:peptide/nickel transport system ATP-binding protein [Rhizobiales bacterium GAS188]|nr:peptide/nickel transport system ATP-binding protein [Rhizobiales bacterium GAS188]
MALLAVENLTVSLVKGRLPILNDISLTLEAGEVLGIVGESGSGKSMLAMSIMGLLPPALRQDGGAVRIDGEDLAAEGRSAWRKRRGRDLAMIFQEPMTALNPIMRVGRQVEEVLSKRRGLAHDAARRETLDLFQRVEIPRARSMLGAFPHEMSGGMRQRVMIAMALAARARILIADEPTTALDVTIQAQILDLLRDLRQAYNMGVLFITHDLGVIAEIADRVVVLYAGRVAEIAPVEAVFDTPRHPYTRALLSAIPKTQGPRGRLVSIDGAVPGVGAMPPGCRFSPRCSLSLPACNFAPPPVMAIGPHHGTACIEPFGYVIPERDA